MQADPTRVRHPGHKFICGPGTIAMVLLPLLALTAMMVSPTAQAEKPKLKKCNIGTDRLVRCGHIQVPTVRGFPKLGKEKIGFAVRPRGDQSKPSRGTIIFTEGGPGFAATNSDSARSATAVFKPFLKHRELVFFDQRGTGRSEPVRCRGLQRGTQSYNKAVRSCYHQMGPRARGMTTANSAADIKALIERMNLKNVILYGDSYGTYLGQSFAARYGKMIKGLILSSSYPGNNGFWPTLYPAAINAVDVACDRAKNCSGNAVGRYKKVIRQLGTRNAKSKAILEYLMDAASFSPNSYRNLNVAVSRFLRGDRAPLLELTAPYGPNQGSPSYFSVGMYTAVICNDYPVPWDKDSVFADRKKEFQAAIKSFRPNNLFSPFSKNEWMHSPASDIANCLAWPKHKYKTEPSIPVGTKMPAKLKTLVVAGEFDDITSVKEGRQVTKRFPSGRLYIARNRGHASDLYYPFASAAVPRIRHFIGNLGK